MIPQTDRSRRREYREEPSVDCSAQYAAEREARILAHTARVQAEMARLGLIRENNGYIRAETS